MFDVLWSAGEDVTGKTLLQRRALLQQIIKPEPGIQVATYLDTEGIALFNAVKAKGIDGIMTKRKNSIYPPGRRTSDWLKIKSRLQQEFVGAEIPARIFHEHRHASLNDRGSGELLKNGPVQDSRTPTGFEHPRQVIKERRGKREG